MTTVQPILSLKDFTFSYDGAMTPALNQVSMDFFPGQKVALMGVNGSGKSTLFLSCMGLLTPDSGRLVCDGRIVTRKKKDLSRLRETVGIVFQEPDNQLISTTVENEIAFGPLNLGLTIEEVRERTERAMEQMDLTQLRDRPPHLLSGGEKRRVSIADVLSMRSRLIFLDEPTTSLDQVNLARLEEALGLMSDQGIGLVVATHDVDFAWSWADRVIVMSGGDVMADDSVDAILTDAELLRRAQLGSPTLVRLARILPGDVYPRSVDEFISCCQSIEAPETERCNHA